MGVYSAGIAQRIGRLAGLVIPKEVRDAFARDQDAEPATVVAVDGGAAVLRTQGLTCAFCASREHVIPFHGKGICVDCVAEVRGLVSAG